MMMTTMMWIELTAIVAYFIMGVITALVYRKMFNGPDGDAGELELLLVVALWPIGILAVFASIVFQAIEYLLDEGDRE